MAGKYLIYKYVKLAGKGWRYARAAYHPNRKIKPNIVIVKGVNGKRVEEKHAEGSYFLNFNNTWISVGADALEAQYQRKLKLNQAEYERLSGKSAGPGPNLIQLEKRTIQDEVDAYLANLELAKRTLNEEYRPRPFPISTGVVGYSTRQSTRLQLRNWTKHLIAAVSSSRQKTTSPED